MAGLNRPFRQPMVFSVARRWLTMLKLWRRFPGSSNTAPQHAPWERKRANTKLFSVSGHIRKPGVYELEMGYPFMKFLGDCGGVPNGRNSRA